MAVVVLHDERVALQTGQEGLANRHRERDPERVDLIRVLEKIHWKILQLQ